ncbi:MAG: hypothetical protein QNI84_13270 [Henriciella sp.]|nr:hypothetical protein [Henriciella sp.]
MGVKFFQSGIVCLAGLLAACSDSAVSEAESERLRLEIKQRVEQTRALDQARIAACMAEHAADWVAIDEAITGSDHLGQHEDMLRLAASRLVCERKCSLRQLSEEGGFWSAGANRPNLYFTYCGDGRADRKHYVNAITGAVFTPESDGS